MTDYQSGFANYCQSEAIAGALPQGRNSPQHPAFGLYAEQMSGTAFTVPRADNRRSWLYRIRPSAAHPAFSLMHDMRETDTAPPSPNRMRWPPVAMPDGAIDLLDSIAPVLINGDALAGTGASFNTYACTRSMEARAFFNADAEMLFIPQQGGLTLLTEMGRIDLDPHEIAVVPRGIKLRIEVPDGQARGFLIENFGAPFRLPELGPLGANGLANPRDFLTPVAWFEDLDEPFELIQKFGGAIWRTMLDHSPLDVVAWHGNGAPFKYDLRRFNTMGTVSYDHPDPSIYTVLTSPSAEPGRANADLVIFPSRWLVAEDTFRPPWFHRNPMAEAMGLVSGSYDAKAGLAPGSITLHNSMAAHGPDIDSWHQANAATLVPDKIDNALAFMIESCWPWRVTTRALALAEVNYDAVWAGFPKAQLPV